MAKLNREYNYMIRARFIWGPDNRVLEKSGGCFSTREEAESYLEQHRVNSVEYVISTIPEEFKKEWGIK